MDFTSYVVGAASGVSVFVLFVDYATSWFKQRKHKYIHELLNINDLDNLEAQAMHAYVLLLAVHDVPWYRGVPFSLRRSINSYLNSIGGIHE